MGKFYFILFVSLFILNISKSQQKNDKKPEHPNCLILFTPPFIVDSASQRIKYTATLYDLKKQQNIRITKFVSKHKDLYYVDLTDTTEYAMIIKIRADTIMISDLNKLINTASPCIEINLKLLDLKNKNCRTVMSNYCIDYFETHYYGNCINHEGGMKIDILQFILPKRFYKKHKINHETYFFIEFKKTKLVDSFEYPLSK